jgi:hypothetical protein
MLTSRALSKRVDRKRASLRNSQKALSLITGENRRGNITDTQTEALQKVVMSMYLSEYLQATLEPSVEEFVEWTRQQLEDQFDDLFRMFAARRYR